MVTSCFFMTDAASNSSLSVQCSVSLSRISSTTTLAHDEEAYDGVDSHMVWGQRLGWQDMGGEGERGRERETKVLLLGVGAVFDTGVRCQKERLQSER